MKTKLPKCPRTKCKNNAHIDPTYGVLPCKKCQAKDTKKVKKVRNAPEFYTLSERDRIIHQRDRFAKDIIQPWINNKPNPEFVKAYPEMRDTYFSEEQLREI